ncbi:MAG: hypothetical protein VYD90_13245 [Pseudomonadota bacterium]|nr:hypothetical protein [Pseudomonadota bacterium]
MGGIADKFAEVFRDRVVDGVLSSGLNDVDKTQARAIGPIIEAAIANIGTANLADYQHATKAEADTAASGYSDGEYVLVWGDSTDTNNDLWLVDTGALVQTGTNGILHDIVSALLADYIAQLNGSLSDIAANKTDVSILQALLLDGTGSTVVTSFVDDLPNAVPTSTFTGGSNVVMSMAVTEDTVIRQFALIAVATGIVTVRSWTKSGDTFTEYARQTVTVTETGYQQHSVAVPVPSGGFVGFVGANVVGRLDGIASPTNYTGGTLAGLTFVDADPGFTPVYAVEFTTSSAVSIVDGLANQLGESLYFGEVGHTGVNGGAKVGHGAA